MEEGEREREREVCLIEVHGREGVRGNEGKIIAGNRKGMESEYK